MNELSREDHVALLCEDWVCAALDAAQTDLDRQKAAARERREALHRLIAERYGMRDGDALDKASGRIIRRTE